MRVAILMPLSEKRGGGEGMLQQLMRHGRQLDVDWIVIFFKDGPLVAEFARLGVLTHVLKAGRLREVGRFIRAVVKINSIVANEEVDLLMSWSAKPHLYGSIAAKFAGIPSAWYQLGCPEGVHLSWIDRIATMLPARGVLTLSGAGLEAQARLWPMRPIHLAYPGVELSRFDPGEMESPRTARKRLDLPTEGPLIGMVGRLQRWKGMHVLVDAMPQILAAHPDAHGVIVGDRHELEPEYADALRSRISELGLDRRIFLVGYRDDIPTWMNAMDVIVHASDFEPFGIVVIEAMALGKPVVAGSEGGPAEIIDDQVDGLLAPYGDADRLSEQILRYLDNPEFMHTVGTAARRRALMFSPQRYANDVVNALREMVAHPSRAGVQRVNIPGTLAPQIASQSEGPDR